MVCNSIGSPMGNSMMSNNSSDNLLEIYRTNRVAIDFLQDPTTIFIVDYLGAFGPMPQTTLRQNIHLPPRVLQQNLEELIHGQVISDDNGDIDITPLGRWLLSAFAGDENLSRNKETPPRAVGIEWLLELFGPYDFYYLDPLILSVLSPKCC